MVLLIASTPMFLGGWTAKPKDDFNINKLFKQWEQSENWILIKHETNAGAHDISGMNIFQRRTIMERNGNVFALTEYHDLDPVMGAYPSDCTHSRYVWGFDDKGNGMQYYGRRYYGKENWHWMPESGGGFEGTIHEQFYKHIGTGAMYHIKNDLKAKRKDGDTYYFSGAHNVSQFLRSMGDKIGEPDLIMSFMYTLIFDASEATAPPQDFPTRMPNNVEVEEQKRFDSHMKEIGQTRNWWRSA